MGTSGCGQVETAGLRGRKMIPQVFKLCFLRQRFEMDEIVLHSIVCKRNVLRNFYQQLSGGGAVENGSEAEMQDGCCFCGSDARLWRGGWS